MIFILSPTKNMKVSSNFKGNFQQSIFKNETLKLHSILKNLQPFEIESLMKVNPQIAIKTFANFQEFDFEKLGAPAILSYTGLVFKNLAPFDFSEEELIFSNEHLRILSGFYGVLKACDNIYPYRLEMQCKLSFDDFRDLYEFWGDLIYQEIFKNGDVVLNLASDEYFKVIKPFLKSSDKIINVQFLTFKSGKFRTIATNAKILRGKMARFIIKNKIKSVDEIKQFSEDGYVFDKYLSEDGNYIFKNY